MRRLFPLLSIALATGLATFLAVPAIGGEDDAPEPATPAAEHMEVDLGTTCDGCHAEMTPEIYEGWFAGKHGLNNVDCFVCHGSTGEDFSVRVSEERCLGCHARRVESLEAAGFGDTSCFACHPPHRLTPHTLEAPPAETGDPAEPTDEGGDDR